MKNVLSVLRILILAFAICIIGFFVLINEPAALKTFSIIYAATLTIFVAFETKALTCELLREKRIAASIAESTNILEFQKPAVNYVHTFRFQN